MLVHSELMGPWATCRDAQDKRRKGTPLSCATLCVTLHYVTLHYVTLCVTLHYITLCHVMFLKLKKETTPCKYKI